MKYLVLNSCFLDHVQLFGWERSQNLWKLQSYVLNVVFSIKKYYVNSRKTFYFLKTSLRTLRYFVVQLSFAPSGDQRGNEKPRVLEDPAVAMETSRELWRRKETDIIQQACSVH